MMKHGLKLLYSKNAMATLVVSSILLMASKSEESPLTKEQATGAAVVDAEACEGLCGVEPASQTTMGRFLETQIAERVELVSGKAWTKISRLKMARELSIAIAKASYEYDLDPFLLLAIVEVESRYNTMAVGTVGERGLMQIRPQTASWVVPVTDSLHGCDLHQVACNIATGAHYLSHLEKQVAKRELDFENKKAERIFLLRSYNLGPARAYRLALEQSITTIEREPAADTATTATEPTPVPYADKITARAARFQYRYLQAATTKQVVTTVALAN